MGRLYEIDIVEWAEQQAALLGRLAAGERVNNDDLDWSDLAEEIEALGGSYRKELDSRISTLLIHLMKLAASPANAPRVGWRETVREQRDEINRLLKQAPSLVRSIPEVIRGEMAKAAERTRASLSDYGERPQGNLDTVTFAPEQVLDDWFPAAPTTPA